MEKLIQNTTNIYGNKGKAWLANLPKIVNQLCDKWKLYQLSPVENMSYNYVARAITSSNLLVVLKISCDEKLFNEEERALRYFDGRAAIRLIDSDKEHYALLLSQAIPGTTLKSLYPASIDFVMDNYIAVVKKLHSKRLIKQYNHRHINDWLKAIDNASSALLPADLIRKAINLKAQLLQSSTQKFFLHGDLHHDNILQHGEEWLTIDPKGIVGEIEFEVAAFDFISSSELATNLAVKNIFQERVSIFANKSGLNFNKIKDWIFIRLILSAVWSVQDNTDPGWAINLAKVIE